MKSIREVILEELSASLNLDDLAEGSIGFLDDTVLLDTGLDSLGFAVLVARLERSLGYDPFTLDPNPNYPRTLAEFISMYQKFEEYRK